jgi:streptothricin acetyltransferase
MQIVIKEMDRHTLQDANRCHESFTITDSLVVTLQDGRISYAIQPLSAYDKQYPPNEVDYAAYLIEPDNAVFFAYVDDAIAGEIVIRKWWNNLAYIEDISILSTFRRKGIGRALVGRALEWARESQLPGVMLETQNNNVGACLLYESCGFTLGGFDRYLYHGLHKDETALYWYLFF